MRAAGAQITTSESLIFELMKDSKHENFKPISGIIVSLWSAIVPQVVLSRPLLLILRFLLMVIFYVTIFFFPFSLPSFSERGKRTYQDHSWDSVGKLQDLIRFIWNKETCICNFYLRQLYWKACFAFLLISTVAWYQRWSAMSERNFCRQIFKDWRIRRNSSILDERSKERIIWDELF